MKRGCAMLTERSHFSMQQDEAKGHKVRRSQQKQLSQEMPLFLRKKGSKNGYATRPKTTFINESLIIQRYQPEQTPHGTDYCKQMNQTLENQNINLKQHNCFLVEQVKSMFQREKKYKKSLLLNHQKIKKLQNINKHLSRQIHVLSTSIVMEIQRIQQIIKKEQSIMEEELKICSREYQMSLETQGWETEQSVNSNLENLKRQVSDLFTNNGSDCINECCSALEYKVNDNGRKTVFSLNSENVTAETTHRTQKSKFFEETHLLSQTYSFQNLISQDAKENFTININCK